MRVWFIGKKGKKVGRVYFFCAVRIQTRAQARATGIIPMETKRTRLPSQGFNPMAAMIGISRETTMPALFFLDRDSFFLPWTALGAGLNILGRIRIPEINRTKTRISLTPVKAFSLLQGVIKMLLYFKDSRICQSYSGGPWYCSDFDPCETLKKLLSGWIC